MTKRNIEEHYITAWKNKIKNEDLPQLKVYKQINNNEFTTAKHLDLPFPLRRINN